MLAKSSLFLIDLWKRIALNLKEISNVVITNYFIPPHPSLQPFIDHYILSTSGEKNIILKSSWPASNETSLVFYLADKPTHHTTENKNSSLANKQGCVIGLLTHVNGTVSFNGLYHTFIIQFKANGFNKLFSLGVSEFVNKIFYSNDIFGKVSGDLNEALLNTADMQQMACFADKFLLYFLNKQKANTIFNDGITYISNQFFSNAPLLSVEQYADKANMSVRNFARRFIEQTGVSPRLYCRLLRFNNAVTLKFKKPNISWTSIAHECGYFDQMHMIKDFKKFSNVTPSGLFQKSTGFSKPGTDIPDLDKKGIKQKKDNLPGPEFVFVKRAGF